MNSEIIIREAADIEKFIPDVGVFRLKRKTLVVQIAGLSADENHQVQEEITRHYRVCGCTQGKIAGIATIAVAGCFWLLGIIPFAGATLGDTALEFSVCLFAMMLAGKLFGLWRARVALEKWSRHLEKRQNQVGDRSLPAGQGLVWN